MTPSASGPRTAELVLGETAQEIPLYDSKLLYNAVMVDLRQKVEGYPGTERAAFARLTAGADLVSLDVYFLPTFQEMRWPKAEVRARREGETAVFTSNVFAWRVCVDLDG